MDFENEIAENSPQEEIAPVAEPVTVDDEAKAKKGKRVTKIISTVLSCMLLIFIVALFFRMCQAGHKEFKDLQLSNAFKDAYKISTDVRTHVAGEEFSNNGALYAYTFVYNEKAGYMQLTVRYNTRHIDEVVSAINENARAQGENSAKEYTRDDIRVYYTVTDSNGRVYGENDITVLGRSEKYNYVYFKLEASCIDFKAKSLTVNMMLENVEQVERDGKTTLVYKQGASTSAGSTLTFHTSESTYIPYDFSRKEKKELGIK